MHRHSCAASLVIATLGCLLATGCGWSSVGGGKVAKGAASDGKVAVVGGVTYAAFSDGANGGKLTVMREAGGAWVVVGTRGFSPTSVGTSGFALAGDGTTLYVAFTTANGVGVMKFAGNAWASVGPAETAVSGSVSTLFLAVASGKLYLGVGAASAHVFAFSGTDWSDQATGLPSAVSSFLFATAPDGTLYAAYNDYGRSLLALAKYANGSWSELGTSEVTITEEWAPSLWATNDAVFIIFQNYQHGAVVLKWDGKSLDSVGPLGSISAGDSIEYVSGAVSAGVPYVAFDDESRDSDPEPKAATVKQWTGSAWTLYAGYPNPCDIENTYLYAETPGARLFLTYSDCDGDMTVQVH